MWKENEDIIYFPVKWRRNGNGFTIEDLREDRFDEVVEIFKKHYIPNDILYNNTRILKEDDSLKSFSDRLLFTLRNNSSVVAFDDMKIEDDGTECGKKKNVLEKPTKRGIAGVLVMRTISKFDYGRVMSRTKLTSGDSMHKLVRLREHMYRKTDFFAKYNCDTILRIYDLCVKPEYRHIGLGYQLLTSAVEVGRANSVGVIIGLFQTEDLQNVAMRFGMTPAYTLKLSTWTDEYDNLVFCDNVTEDCVLMELAMPPFSCLKPQASPKSVTVISKTALKSPKPSKSPPKTKKKK